MITRTFKVENLSYNDYVIITSTDNSINFIKNQIEIEIFRDGEESSEKILCAKVIAEKELKHTKQFDLMLKCLSCILVIRKVNEFDLNKIDVPQGIELF